MPDITPLQEIRETCCSLRERLQREPHWPELRSIYLDLAPLIGQLQGLVSQATRQAPESQATQHAERSLQDLKSAARQVGLDIRLASEAALAVGLRTALEKAEETLDWLDREE